MNVSQLFNIAFCPLNEAQIPFYGSDELGIAFDPDVLTELARRLQLSFLPEENVNMETCFLHSHGLRPEFRVSFNLRDFAHFIHTALQEQGCTGQDVNLISKKRTIPYPQDVEAFWELVAAGVANDPSCK
jgi:hypothetical protein